MSSTQDDVPPSAGVTPLSDGPTTIPGAIPPFDTLASNVHFSEAVDAIAQAQARHEALRTDQMIAAAIGFVAYSYGREQFILDPEELLEFGRTHRVTLAEQSGVVIYRVVEKGGAA